MAMDIDGFATSPLLITLTLPLLFDRSCSFLSLGRVEGLPPVLQRCYGGSSFAQESVHTGCGSFASFSVEKLINYFLEPRRLSIRRERERERERERKRERERERGREREREREERERERERCLADSVTIYFFSKTLPLGIGP